MEVARTERPGPKLIKELFAVAAVTGLIISLAGSTPAHDEKKDRKGEIQRSMAVNPQATITLCVASGTLTVHGWDKNEVRVRSVDAAQLDFRRIDKVKDPQQTPASRVDVMVLDKNWRAAPREDCQAIADVEMEVPASATVQVQTRDGDISIAGVAAAYAGSQNGDISIARATKLVEAGSVGGIISLKDSSGRVSLSSAGGGVEATNVRASSPDDTFEVGTVSGDIQLDHISNPKVLAKTVSGTLTMSGALAKQGYYGFTSMSGDMLLALPHDSSFRLNAKVSEKHNIVSEFNLKYLNESSPSPPAIKRTPAPPGEKAPKAPPAKEKEKDKDKPLPRTGPVIGPIVIEKPAVVVHVLRRVDAIYGTGDATIAIASFGGTVHLKKL